jgi:peptidoglycan hydrolase-like protein with peptidoglycan-binding domain
MTVSWRVIGWLPWLLLTACVASQTGDRAAVDRLLTRGDVQGAQAHLQDFGFDPGPVDGLYTAQSQAAVRAYQAHYGLPVSGLLDEATRRRLLPGLDFQHGR